jgi:hypothetical protein
MIIIVLVKETEGGLTRTNDLTLLGFLYLAPAGSLDSLRPFILCELVK